MHEKRKSTASGWRMATSAATQWRRRRRRLEGGDNAHTRQTGSSGLGEASETTRECREARGEAEAEAYKSETRNEKGTGRSENQRKHDATLRQALVSDARRPEDMSPFTIARGTASTLSPITAAISVHAFR